MTEVLVFIGFGGHARSVADVALAIGFKKIAFIDSNARPEETFLGFPVSSKYPQDLNLCFPGAGDNYRREQQTIEAIQKNWPLATIVSQKAAQGHGSIIEEGTFVGNFAHIGPMVTVGKACIINTGAIVEHDCTIGAFSHISVNTTIAGKVSIGRHVFVGAGATVRDGVSITDDVIIGAGACVVNDLTCAGVYTGVPAKLVKTQHASHGL